MPEVKAVVVVQPILASSWNSKVIAFHNAPRAQSTESEQPNLQQAARRGGPTLILSLADTLAVGVVSGGCI